MREILISRGGVEELSNWEMVVYAYVSLNLKNVLKVKTNMNRFVFMLVILHII